MNCAAEQEDGLETRDDQWELSDSLDCTVYPTFLNNPIISSRVSQTALNYFS